MTTQLFFFLPNREDQWPIHVKGNHRSASRGRLANYQSSLPTKMLRPPFSSRTVECHFFSSLWVNRSLARSLTQ
jgi:hypothetical protein